MVLEESLSLEEQNINTGMCLECHTAILMSEENTKRTREKLYEVVKDKYCGQCESPLYHEKKYR